MNLHHLLIGALALGGCTSSRTNPPPTTPPATATATATPPAADPDMAGMCPMSIEGTTARAEDVEGGVAMVFTTTGDVAELRARVARMAAMHSHHPAGGPGPGPGMHGPGAGGPAKHAHPGGGPHPGGGMKPGGMGGMKPGGMGGGMMKMPPSSARSEDVEGGARIVLTPRDPAQVAALQEHARHMAARMASGQCPMMTMQGGAPAAPDA